jgi:hypothetical protein
MNTNSLQLQLETLKATTRKLKTTLKKFSDEDEGDDDDDDDDADDLQIHPDRLDPEKPTTVGMQDHSSEPNKSRRLKSNRSHTVHTLKFCSGRLPRRWKVWIWHGNG